MEDSHIVINPKNLVINPALLKTDLCTMFGKKLYSLKRLYIKKNKAAHQKLHVLSSHVFFFIFSSCTYTLKINGYQQIIYIL